MLSPQGDCERSRGGEVGVVYVGDERTGEFLAQELADVEVDSIQSPTAALDRVESDGVDCVVVETEATADAVEFLDAVEDRSPDTARVLVGESVESAPQDVTFVPTDPSADLAARAARRVERALDYRSVRRERDWYVDRFEALVDRSPDPIVTINEDREVVFANDAVERVFGYEVSTLVGEPVERLLDESVHGCLAESVASLFADDGLVQRDYVELPGRHRDGRTVPLAVSFRETASDGDHYISAVVRDVTERRRLEDRLEAEQRKTKELHEVAVMLEECGTAEEVYQLAVRTAEELLEFDLAAVDTVADGELVPRAVSEGVPSDGYYTTTPLSADDNLAARAYRRGESLLVADLREQNVNPAASGYRAALSVPIGDIGVFQAVSKEPNSFDESDRELAELLVSHVAQALRRVRSESALAAERDRFAALFENVPEPTARYTLRDGEPVIESVNEAFETVFGYDEDEAVGESLDDLLVPDDRAAEATQLNERVCRGERVDAEVERVAADGRRDFLLRNAEVSGDGGNYVIYTDITERKRSAERYRSMTEDVLDNTDVGIFVLDDEFEVAWANATVEEYFGLAREEVLGADKTTLVDERIRHLVDDSAAFKETVTATYEDNSYVEEFTCHVRPGDGRTERHLQHRSRPIESGLYAGGRVELYYDVTERVEREANLDALHDATRDLMAADDQSEIYCTMVETAREVLGVPHASVFRWNDETELLEPDVVPDDTTATIGEPPCFEPGEGIVGSVYESGVSEHFDNAWDDPRAAEDGSQGVRAFGAFPLDGWGVLTIASPTVGAFDDYEIDLVRVLAANAEVALNRAAREAELDEQREQLAELDRINAVIRDVDQLLVRASTREEIEQAVCDRLADSDQYRFAWTGETMPGPNEARPTAWAGVEDGFLDVIAERRDDAPRGPGRDAIETGEVQVVESVSDDESYEPWRDAALERGYHSMAAIPLVYRETVYGVLCVYVDRANAFDDRERAVLAELGETIGHAINAAENKKALLSDGVLEVEFAIGDGEGFFAEVAREEAATFSLEGVTVTSNGSFVYFMTVDDLAPERVLARADDAPNVERARLVNEHDDGNLFEFVYTGPSPLPVLADHGGTLRHVEYSEDGGRSVVDLPRKSGVRSVVEAIQETIPTAEVVAQRERERPERTVEEFRTALEDELTDRQRSALEAAYYAGFFEWPRESTGEEVSDSLGVSAPTFHQHLRVGERKLLAAFLDG